MNIGKKKRFKFLDTCVGKLTVRTVGLFFMLCCQESVQDFFVEAGKQRLSPQIVLEYYRSLSDFFERKNYTLRFQPA